MSLSDRFQLYYQDTVALVQSLSIKFDIQNTLLNNYMTEVGYDVDEDDESTWKYNMNLAGLYHSADETMTVVSLDTKESITFDKDTLANHPRTLIYYSQTGDGYKELVRKYPKQEILIKGILNDLDLDDVVDADDFQILSYSTDLVYSNELTFIDRLQDWIDLYAFRRFNKEWCATNPLYATDFIGTFAQNLVTAAMVIRADLAGTEQACQFEIWSELSCHYNLDDYKPYLTLAQSIWLYRNIRNIRRNAGKQSIMTDIFENLLEPNGLLIKRLDYYLNTSTFLSTQERTPRFSLTEYTNDVVNQASGDVLSVTDVYEMTEERGTDNSRVMDNRIEDATTTAEALLYNNLPTKVHRVDQDSESLIANINLLSMKSRYWAYLGYLGYYDAELSIEIPNGDTVVLDPLDALRLFIYAGKQAADDPITDLPTVTAGRVIPVTYPTSSELTGLIMDSDLIDQDTIDDMLEDTVTVTTLTSVTDFSDFVDQCHDQDTRYDSFASCFPTQNSQANIYDIANALVIDYEMDLSDGDVTTYETWLDNKGIEFPSDIDLQDWYDLCATILSVAVDYTEDETSVGAKQSAVIEIIDMLTSYRVMFIEGNSTGRSIQIDWPFNLVSPMYSSADITSYIDTAEYVTHQSETAVSTTQTFNVEIGPDIDLYETNNWIVVDISEEIVLPWHTTDDDYVIEAPEARILVPTEVGEEADEFATSDDSDSDA